MLVRSTVVCFFLLARAGMSPRLTEIKEYGAGGIFVKSFKQCDRDNAWLWKSWREYEIVQSDDLKVFYQPGCGSNATLKTVHFRNLSATNRNECMNYLIEYTVATLRTKNSDRT